jgi:predicted DNA-binding transcriptional regulator AlpA
VRQKIQTDHPDSLLRPEDAAELLGLSSRWLELRRLKGDGPPFVRVSPKCVRYRMGDLQAWIAARRRKDTAGNPAPAAA